MVSAANPGVAAWFLAATRAIYCCSACCVDVGGLVLLSIYSTHAYALLAARCAVCAPAAQALPRRMR